MKVKAALIILCLVIIGVIVERLRRTADCDKDAIWNSIFQKGTKSEYYAKVQGIALDYNDKLITTSNKNDIDLVLDKLAFGTSNPEDVTGGFPVQVKLILSCGSAVPFQIIYNPKMRNILTFEYSVGSRLSFRDPFQYRTVRCSDEEIRSSHIVEFLDRIVGER